MTQIEKGIIINDPEIVGNRGCIIHCRRIVTQCLMETTGTALLGTQPSRWIGFRQALFEGDAPVSMWLQRRVIPNRVAVLDHLFQFMPSKIGMTILFPVKQSNSVTV